MLFLYQIGFLQVQSEYLAEHEVEEGGAVRDRDWDLQRQHPGMYAVCVNNDLCREIVGFL
mgnify:CR=1 FL=1